MLQEKLEQIDEPVNLSNVFLPDKGFVFPYEPVTQEYTLSWKAAYQQMAAEREESLEWGKWESTNEDGLDD